MKLGKLLGTAAKSALAYAKENPMQAVAIVSLVPGAGKLVAKAAPVILAVAVKKEV